MKIEFNPVSKLSEIVVPEPKSAKNYIPQWYEEIKPFNSKKPRFDNFGNANKTIKMCMPFLDSITAGYIQESWQDIYIETIDEETQQETFKYYYPSDPKIMSMRAEQSSVKLDDSYHDLDLVWHSQWAPSLPKGYSALIVHPLNRHDLPFYTMSGIVDSDSLKHSESQPNLPFILKKNFSGVIKKGTPLYQIIPIKRENWYSFKNAFNEIENLKQTFELKQYFWGAYKKIHWHKKTYN